jgi:protein-L-isoaspartate O-methyltransferase
VAEIFPREAAADPEPFTGERLTSALSGQTQIEHYHRYLYARALCRGLDVLDVASGEGYGAAQIAQVARRVVGVEFATATVRGAMRNFRRDNLVFAQGDARALPLPDGRFDVAVSFETIEHFDRQEAFVAEVRRVLRPAGRFIVSTPDREVYSAPGTAPNPFHVREMNRDEFVALLRQQFRHVRLLPQRPLIGSALLGEDGNTEQPVVFDRTAPAQFSAGPALPRAPYLVAIASNDPVPPPPASLFIDRSDLDTDALAAADRVREVAALRTENATHMAAAAELSSQLAEARTKNAALVRELEATRGSLRTFLRAYLPRLRRHLLP